MDILWAWFKIQLLGRDIGREMKWVSWHCGIELFNRETEILREKIRLYEKDLCRKCGSFNECLFSVTHFRCWQFSNDAQVYKNEQQQTRITQFISIIFHNEKMLAHESISRNLYAENDAQHEFAECDKNVLCRTVINLRREYGKYFKQMSNKFIRQVII